MRLADCCLVYGLLHGQDNDGQHKKHLLVLARCTLCVLKDLTYSWLNSVASHVALQVLQAASFCLSVTCARLSEPASCTPWLAT
jgi:hypothetical protein